MIKNLIILILIASCSHTQKESYSSPYFSFQFSYKSDQDYIESEISKLNHEANRINNFWKVDNIKPITIEIGKFSENSNIKNCARIFGTEKIYIHSLESLKFGPSQELINSFCLKRQQSDITDSILHEYSHTRHLLFLGKRKKPPMWIWEGLAKYISGEYRRSKANIELNNSRSIDLCNYNFSEEDSYNLAPYIFEYLEKLSPGVALDLAQADSLKKIERVLISHSISCNILI